MATSPFHSYWLSLSRQQRQIIARTCDVSVGYLRLVAGGHRKASWILAQRIERASGGAVTAKQLRPDIFQDS